MIQLDPAAYGREWASDYDELDALSEGATLLAVRTLFELAAGRPILETAAGTGRIAIPLARLGLQVRAEEASPEMLKRLVVKDFSNLVETAVVCLPRIGKGKQYGLITLLINSLWVMVEVQEQEQFFKNAYQKLEPGGLLVIEMGVAHPKRWQKPLAVRRGSTIKRRTSQYRETTQRVDHTFELAKSSNPQHTDRRTVHLRYVLPAQARDMAAKAGFSVAHEWSDWHKTPFGMNAEAYIGVFSKAAPDGSPAV